MGNGISLLRDSKSKINLLPLIFFFISAAPMVISGQNTLPYPEIKSLLPSDLMLKQLQEDLAFYHITSQAGEELPLPGLYQYKTGSDDDLFSLSARFNIPYETMASLNRISAPGPLEEGIKVLVPNQPGLFIYNNPETELESFIITYRAVNFDMTGLKALNIYSPGGIQRAAFFPGERFHSIERAFFLGILFRNPIPAARLTSGFGTRISPISGNCHFHNGIDLAAPRGTPVIPARTGVVKEVGENSLYGKYILISHQEGWETFYAHLKKTFVQLNQSVTSSIIIGEVGDTGQTTGPHLHFELRRNGGTVNPETLLPGIRG
ncbi:MAG: M23 family metallopeptidase [Spirochaetales bacterium]|nr:M23 family metallopeptidase [Spirochaetales bacterium]